MTSGPTTGALVRPDFLVLGAAKSGTTALAHALAAHPELFLPAAKEAHHFGNVPDAEVGGESYRRFFAGRGGQRLMGEASPSYLSSAEAAVQIVRHVPDVRAIVVLRNPVDRAYSGYWHGVRTGLVRGSFEDVLDDESRALARGRIGFATPFTQGCYAPQLQHYFDVGLERGQLLVLLHDDLVHHPADALVAVQRFLGIEPVVTSLPRSNSARLSTLPGPLRRVAFHHRHSPRVAPIWQRSMFAFSPPPMDPLTRLGLLRRYRPYNDALADLIGRDLTHWGR